jgi:hypothetical protein
MRRAWKRAAKSSRVRQRTPSCCARHSPIIRAPDIVPRDTDRVVVASIRDSPHHPSPSGILSETLKRAKLHCETPAAEIASGYHNLAAALMRMAIPFFETR